MGDQYITDKSAKRLDLKQIGFEDNTTRLSELREIITEVTFNPLIESVKRQYNILPWDYLTFLEAEGEVYYSCTNTDLEFTTTTAPEYIATSSFKTSDFGSPTSTPFSAVKLYKVIATVPTLIFSFSDYSDGLSDIDEIFTVKNKLIHEVNKLSNIKAYWERYRDLYYPDRFIFVSTDATFASNAMRLDYTVTPSAVNTFVTTNYTKVLAGTEAFDTRDSFCRLISSEEVSHLLSNPFGTTSSSSPIISIIGDKLISYINKRFILKGLTLKYLRKPRRMSLPLNQSYEIQDIRALEKIIDMSVEYLLATVQSQGYQMMAAENMMKD